MKLSLIIPVFNEELHLAQVLEQVLAVRFPCDVEYIIVDDCSSDSSWSILEKFSLNREDVSIYRMSDNGGKGAALRQGFAQCTGDIVAIQDADFEYDPKDLPRLVEPILAGRADVVYGSRYHKNRVQVHRTFHYFVNRILTLMSNMLSGVYLSDMETCYKVFRAEIIKNLIFTSDRFGFEPEVTAYIAKLRVRVEEHPISYFPRNYSEGKKIGWKDGVAAIWFIFKYNFKGTAKAVTSHLPPKYLPGRRQYM